VTEFKKYNRRRARLHQTKAQHQVCPAGSLLFSIFIFFTARLEI
jgi:hypothetical protein